MVLLQLWHRICESLMKVYCLKHVRGIDLSMIIHKTETQPSRPAYIDVCIY